MIIPYLLSSLIALIPAAVVYLLLSKAHKRTTRELERLMMESAEERQAREREWSAVERRIETLAGRQATLEQALTASGGDLERVRDEGRAQLDSMGASLKQLQDKVEQLQTIRVAAAPEPSAEQPLMDSPVVAEVSALLEQNVPMDEITRRLGLQPGEIALIQGLKQFSTKRR